VREREREKERDRERETHTHTHTGPELHEASANATIYYTLGTYARRFSGGHDGGVKERERQGARFRGVIILFYYFILFLK
jgi:hypothetical protein